MEIPIQNIYYLLCYAYNKLEEGKILDVETEKCGNIENLFARVLSSGISLLIRRGLDRGYVAFDDELSGIRGKINFSVSIRKRLFHQARAFCEYDELHFNVLHNRILKAAIKLLLGTEGLDSLFKDKLSQIYRIFAEIDEIKLHKRDFRLVQLHANNNFYDFLLNISELILDNVSVSG